MFATKSCEGANYIGFNVCDVTKTVKNTDCIRCNIPTEYVRHVEGDSNIPKAPLGELFNIMKTSFGRSDARDDNTVQLNDNSPAGISSSRLR